MSFTTNRNLLFDFLTQPRFRVGRHVLIIVTFALVSVGQVLFVLREWMDALGGGSYLYWGCNAAVMIAAFYLNLYRIAPRRLLKGRYVEYLALLLGTTTAYVALKWAAESLLLAQVGVPRSFTVVTLLDWLSNTLLYAICMASSSVTVLFRQWVADTERISALESTRLQSSVDELKSRLNIPLLFRVLGYAAKKVKTDPGRVSDLIFRLSDELRRELYEGGQRRRVAAQRV